MEKKYYLDLETLLDLLRGKAAILRTTALLLKNRQPCQGFVFLTYGKVARCFILSQLGALLFEGMHAYNELTTCKEWFVRIDSEQLVEQELLMIMQRYSLSYSGYPSSTGPMDKIPRPRRPLDVPFLQQFSQKQSLLLHTVFALVNGERTVAQIKSQLRYAPEAVEEALQVLRTTGFIEL